MPLKVASFFGGHVFDIYVNDMDVDVITIKWSPLKVLPQEEYR